MGLVLRTNPQPKLQQYYKGCFTLWLSVKRTKDSNNVIGGEQKLSAWPSHKRPTTKEQHPPKCLHGNTFCKFDVKCFSGGEEFVHNIYGNPNSHQEDKLFFPNLYKLHNFHILMDFYLVLLR
jgi:hypothetical protein